MRKIFHNGAARLSFGIDYKDGVTKVAFAFCAPNDKFTRAKANLILNNRLDHDGPSRSVFCIKGADPIEIFKHFMELSWRYANDWAPTRRTRIDRLKWDASLRALADAGVCQ